MRNSRLGMPLAPDDLLILALGERFASLWRKQDVNIRKTSPPSVFEAFEGGLNGPARAQIEEAQASARPARAWKSMQKRHGCGRPAKGRTDLRFGRVPN